MGPALGDVMSGLVCEHAITCSVRDSAALLDATAGPALGDPYVAPEPARPFAEEVGRDPGRLRIALVTETPTGLPVDPECVAAATSAAGLCEALGHEIVEHSFSDLDAGAFTDAFLVLWSAGQAALVDWWARRLGREPAPEQLEPLTWALSQMGRQRTAGEYLLALGFLQQASRRIAEAFTGFDVLLSPTMAELPAPLGTFEPSDDDPLFPLLRATPFATFTVLANVTGQPAMSVPLHWTEAGLPVGVMFTGRFGDEATLFRLAAQLEVARPWAERRPPFGGGG